MNIWSEYNPYTASTTVFVSQLTVGSLRRAGTYLDSATWFFREGIIAMACLEANSNRHVGIPSSLVRCSSPYQMFVCFLGAGY